MADLLLNIIGSDGASAALRSVATGFQQLAKFAADCTKEFEAQAKADRQLERYAGDLTGAFKAQASAMQETLGVSDDMVQSMQTMLLRFGEAPESVDATVRALLDYSAATGTDAVQATQTLLTSVNSGKAAFKELGLEYETTGHKSADLTAVTNALAGKLGGSAKAEAGSLSGQTRIATSAINEFKESVGQLISEFATKTGAVGTFTQAIRDLQFALFGAQEDSAANIQKNLDAAEEKLKSMKSGWHDVATFFTAGTYGGYTIEEIKAQEEEVQRLASAWRTADTAKRTANRQSDELADLVGPKDGLTNKGSKQAAAEAKKDAEYIGETVRTAKIDEDEKYESMLEQNQIDSAMAVVRAQQEGMRIEMEQLDKAAKEKGAIQKKLWEEEYAITRTHEKEELKAVEKAQKKLSDEMVAESKRTSALVSEAGAAIGMAFATALAGALAEALEGGEVDVLGLVADIGFAVAAIAGSTIANIYAPGSGTLVGGIIGTAGSLVKGVRSKAWKAEQKSRKHHDGGWVGGATDEQMTTLQNDERVLSRGEVGRMGGKGSVDRMARGHGGGSGFTINVSTMDASSFGDYMGERGGRAVYNTVRTGRGMLTQTALGVG